MCISAQDAQAFEEEATATVASCFIQTKLGSFDLVLDKKRKDLYNIAVVSKKRSLINERSYPL